MYVCAHVPCRVWQCISIFAWIVVAEVVYLTKDGVQNKLIRIASKWNHLQPLHQPCNGGSVLGKMGNALLYHLGQGIPLDHFGLLGSASNAHLWLLLKAHLKKKDSIAVDVHFGAVFIGKLCLWGCVGWVARGNTVTADLLNGVSWAIVGNLGLPAVGSRRLEEDIGAAYISVDDWVWLPLVEVVESTCYVHGNGLDLLIGQWVLRELCSQAGGHELSEDDGRTSLGGGSNEEEEVRMSKSWGNGHLTGEDAKVVVRDDNIVKAFCCHFEASKQSNSDLSICPRAQ